MVGELPVNLGWTGAGLIVVIVGLYHLNRGRKQRRRSKQIAGIETTRIRDIRPGTVEVKGTARPADDGGIVESPFTGADSLATHITVQEWETTGQHGGSWETIYEETNAVPFRVDDGTGEIGVEFPQEGQLNVEQVRITVKSGDAPSEPIRQFIEQDADIGDATRDDLGLLSVGARRQYTEGVIEPGEDIYVLGHANEGTGWDDPDYVIDKPTASGEFILSDKAEEELVQEGTWSGVRMYIFGVTLLGLGLWMMIHPWLPG